MREHRVFVERPAILRNSVDLAQLERSTSTVNEPSGIYRLIET